jgi:hypothetical protein
MSKLVPKKFYKIDPKHNKVSIDSIFVKLGFSMSNWQKVQLNTDLFSDMRKYLYTNQTG